MPAAMPHLVANASTTTFKANIYAYLDSLPTQTFQRLFSKPATCLVILRLLSTLARQIIMTLLYVDKPVPTQHLQRWCRADSQTVLATSLQELQKLHIFTEQGGALQMSTMFRQQLQHALTGGGNHHSFGVPTTEPDRHAVDVAFLDDYATRRWEAILHYMVGTNTAEQPSLSVLGLLNRSGLMQQGATPSSLTITNKGFQFLLQDVSTQVWIFLLQYLDFAENLQMDLVEVLHFLFQLGSLELGASYSTEALTPTQLRMLEDLRDFGIVYQRKKRSKRFYPTRLATTLTTGLHSITVAPMPPQGLTGDGLAAPALPSSSLLSTSNQGFIVLETNYRLYAYTDSPLQIAILNLFVTLKSRFPNMVMGAISRDSVRAALAHGITADQIITYLTVHAHPQMRDRSPVLPITVTDQIRLWEMEKNRIKPTDSCLYSGFLRSQDYLAVLKYAQDLGVVLWHSDTKRMLAVTAEGDPTVRAYVKRKFSSK
ncbi:RNA polymerase II transcription factor B 52 kDa subunit [Dimargaris xerosporica]|nr:RNA polymerase II transcription factor B 52 kDa subunit [Dimargaris xerosporica]